MPTPRRSSRPTPVQQRGSWARTNADLTVNSPDGFPSAYPPVWWIGTDQLHLNAHWNHGGWNDPLGYGSAPRSAVITRATSLITGPLTAAPVKIVSEGTSGLPLPTPRWGSDPCLLRRDSRISEAVAPAVMRLSRSVFWSSWLRYAIWFGLGAFLYTPDESGQPTAGTLRLVDPRFLSTERNGRGPLCWSLDQGDGDPAVFDRDGGLQLGPVRYQLCVLRNPHSPIDTEGMSLGVFAMHPETFGIGGQISNYLAGTFKSGVPSGYLKVETPGLTQETANDLKQAWLRNHGGDRRSIAVLNATTSFVPIQFSPVDAAIGEVTRLAIGDAAYAFGLDPEVLGVTLSNSGTYRNAQEYFQRHKDYGLSPWIAAVQDTLSAFLPGTQGVVINLDSFASPPLSERVETGAAATAAGLMTINEWRQSEGLPPLPEPEPEPAPEPLPAAVEEPGPVDRASRFPAAWRR